MNYSNSYSLRKFAISNSLFPPNSTLETFLKMQLLYCFVYEGLSSFSTWHCVLEKEEMISFILQLKKKKKCLQQGYSLPIPFPLIKMSVWGFLLNPYSRNILFWSLI